MKSTDYNAKALCLKEGEVYSLVFREKQGERGKVRTVKKRMRLIKCYTHHAVFESTKGIRQSFRYWDLEKLLTGQER